MNCIVLEVDLSLSTVKRTQKFRETAYLMKDYSTQVVARIPQFQQAYSKVDFIALGQIVSRATALDFYNISALRC